MAKEFYIIRCFTYGFRAFGRSPGKAVLAIILFSLMGSLTGINPFLSIIYSLVLTGPLLGGLNMFFLNLHKGEQVSLGSIFGGFSYFGKFVLLQWLTIFVYACTSLAIAAPLVLYFTTKTTSIPMLFFQPGAFQQLFGDMFFRRMLILAVAMAVMSLVITFRWVLASYVLADRPEQCRILEAFRHSAEMTAGHRLRIFFAFIAIGLFPVGCTVLLGMFGRVLIGLFGFGAVLFIILGLLALWPITFCALAAIYIQLKDDPEPEALALPAAPAGPPPKPYLTEGAFTQTAASSLPSVAPGISPGTAANAARPFLSAAVPDEPHAVDILRPSHEPPSPGAQATRPIFPTLSIPSQPQTGSAFPGAFPPTPARPSTQGTPGTPSASAAPPATGGFITFAQTSPPVAKAVSPSDPAPKSTLETPGTALPTVPPASIFQPPSITPTPSSPLTPSTPPTPSTPSTSSTPPIPSTPAPSAPASPVPPSAVTPVSPAPAPAAPTSAAPGNVPAPSAPAVLDISATPASSSNQESLPSEVEETASIPATPKADPLISDEAKPPSSFTPSAAIELTPPISSAASSESPPAPVPGAAPAPSPAPSPAAASAPYVYHSPFPPNMEPLRIDQGSVSFKLRGEMLRHGGPVARLALSPDGTLLVSAGRDGMLKAWHRYQGTPAAAFQVDGIPSCLAVSPDRRTVAVGLTAPSEQDGGVVKIYSLTDGTEQGRYRIHQGTVRAVAVNNRGDLGISTDEDRSVHVWDYATGTILMSGKHPDQGLAAGFVPDGRPVSASRDWTLTVWDVKAKEPAATWRGEGGPCHVALSFYGEWLAAAGPRKAHLIEVNSGRSVADWVPAGQILAVYGGPEGSVTVWEAHGAAAKARQALDGNYRTELRGHTGDILALAPSPDGMFLATGGEDGLVGIWEAV